MIALFLTVIIVNILRLEFSAMFMPLYFHEDSCAVLIFLDPPFLTYEYAGSFRHHKYFYTVAHFRWNLNETQKLLYHNL